MTYKNMVIENILIHFDYSIVDVVVENENNLSNRDHIHFEVASVINEVNVIQDDFYVQNSIQDYKNIDKDYDKIQIVGIRIIRTNLLQDYDQGQNIVQDISLEINEEEIMVDMAL